MVGNSAPLASILIVTFDSARHLPACLEAVRAQTYSPRELIFVDNNSTDGTRDQLAELGSSAHVILNSDNRGFAAGQNQAIRAAQGEWLLCLNPDVILAPTFLAELVSAAQLDAAAGALCGKLLRWQPGAQPERTQTIDSAGIYFTRNLRHLDRGAEEEDGGQFEKMECVFGASAAAALYRRKMVEDISVNGEFFDEEFFSYREDADLAWRAQLMGWRCLYVPAAMGWHERRVTPERRAQLPHEINWHSVKNRFLMRIKNIGFGLWWRTFLPATARDLVVLGYALLRDWRMISALAYPALHLRGALKRRWVIQARRKVDDGELARWFGKQRSEPMAESFSSDTRA